MTNNTTSYGGDFTIKPLTTSIDIITEPLFFCAFIFLCLYKKIPQQEGLEAITCRGKVLILNKSTFN